MTTAMLPRSATHTSAGEARRTPAGRPLLDVADLRAVLYAFTLAAAFALSGALFGDAYLAAVLLRGVDAVGDVAAYNLAGDLLPWTAAFSMMTGTVAATGLWFATRLRRGGAAARSAGV